MPEQPRFPVYPPYPVEEVRALLGNRRTLPATNQVNRLCSTVLHLAEVITRLRGSLSYYREQGGEAGWLAVSIIFPEVTAAIEDPARVLEAATDQQAEIARLHATLETYAAQITRLQGTVIRTGPVLSRLYAALRDVSAYIANGNYEMAQRAIVAALQEDPPDVQTTPPPAE